MNFVRDEINQNKTWNKIGNGRKLKQSIVEDWRAKNPTGIKAECIRETGLSKKLSTSGGIENCKFCNKCIAYIFL